MRETVHVGLEGRAYDVVIGPDLLAQAGALIAPLLRRKRVVVVSDETVAAHHLDSLRAGLDAADINVEALALPPGEATKCWAELTRTVDWLMDQKVERNDVVIAFGGGVIGDLVGFAAAILRRGVRFVQIPTSLLAQVDSSVGGKTAINPVLPPTELSGARRGSTYHRARTLSARFISRPLYWPIRPCLAHCRRVISSPDMARSSNTGCWGMRPSLTGSR